MYVRLFIIGAMLSCMCLAASGAHIYFRDLELSREVLPGDIARVRVGCNKQDSTGFRAQCKSTKMTHPTSFPVSTWYPSLEVLSVTPTQ